MKARWLWLVFGVAFSATLAYVIGQRLSAEAMAVMVGVMAGVAASVPTSLLVVWLASRAGDRGTVIEVPAPRPAETPEQRVVVVAQPPQTAAEYQHLAGYAAGAAPVPPAPRPRPPVAAQPARRFTIIGGAGQSAGEVGSGTGSAADAAEEVLWQR